MVLALLAVTAVLGSSRLRGFCALGPRAGHRPGRHRPDHRPAAAHLRPAAARRRHRRRRRGGRHLRGRRGAVGRRPPAPYRRARHPGRAAVDGQGGLEAVLEALAARHRVRLPVRRAAGRRRGDPDVPVLRDREAALASTPRSSATAPSRASPGPEAANNASAAGTLVPMLSLGLPTNATAAVMLAAFTQYGIQPGPLLFEREPQLVWALIASLFIGNTLLLLINLPLAPGVGQAAADPAALPVRRHPVLRDAGRLLGEPAGLRPGDPAGARPARLHDAALRPAGPAADPRRDPRPAAGEAAAHSRCSSPTGTSPGCGPSRSPWWST